MIDYPLWMLLMSILSNILTLLLCILAVITLIREGQKNTRHAPSQHRAHESN